MILEREYWTDKSITFLATDIVEYDMKEAGFSIIKERNLLPKDKIESISSITDKGKRHIQVGLAQRGNKPLRDELVKGFKDFRVWFGDVNNLDDSDILAVKKDAIFVKKFCYNTEYGNHIKFIEKNVYHAFMQFDRYEFYMNDDKIDVKGITDETVTLHENGIIPIIRRVMTLLSQYDETGAVKYVVKIMNDYKFYRLPVECYREFNSVSGYRMMQSDDEIVVQNVGESYKNNLIIDYNYVNVLIPLLNIVMG